MEHFPVTAQLNTFQFRRRRTSVTTLNFSILVSFYFCGTVDHFPLGHSLYLPALLITSQFQRS